MRKQRAERLRFAVQSLPPETQRAMLTGIKENRIVTGANTDRRGGVCPMLAADRDAFSVTPLAEIFATAWDKYTGTSFVNVTRRTANDRDLQVLQSMLETSLALHAAPHAAAAPTPYTAPLPHPELVRTTEALTVAAKLEVIRAVAAAGPTRSTSAPAPGPVARVAPAPTAAAPAPSRRAATAITRAVLAPATRAARASDSEFDREGARAVIANQASTLRRRAWPRPAGDVPEPAQTRSATAPAAVPTPAPAPARTPIADERIPELAAQSGWAWLRPFNSYDDYERTLQDLGETQRGPGADDGGNRRDDTKRREPSHA